MTDFETATMIKNMAREMVKRATAKNAEISYDEFKRRSRATIEGKSRVDGKTVATLKVVMPGNLSDSVPRVPIAELTQENLDKFLKPMYETYLKYTQRKAEKSTEKKSPLVFDPSRAGSMSK